jgi:trans-2,3-dihydro-3-hydroxyanthranilate isomerase
MTTPALPYVHVDVFSAAPYSGNSLPVFPDARGLDARQMLRITQELRHFEAIFLEPTAEATSYRARVFDLFEELPFAGHPIIGAAAVLHRAAGGHRERRWTIELRAKTVTVTTCRDGARVNGVLAQGSADFLHVVHDRAGVARAFDLAPEDLHAELPLQVVSTGLKYLVVPLAPDTIHRARIVSDLTEQLGSSGAQFAVLFDEAKLEQRHWNNDGVVEDIATGSAAGVIGAYRLRHGLASSGASFVLNQGRFASRPSELLVIPKMTEAGAIEVDVGGWVSFVGRGELEAVS